MAHEAYSCWGQVEVRGLMKHTLPITSNWLSHLMYNSIKFVGSNADCDGFSSFVQHLASQLSVKINRLTSSVQQEVMLINGSSVPYHPFTTKLQRHHVKSNNWYLNSIVHIIINNFAVFVPHCYVVVLSSSSSSSSSSSLFAWHDNMSYVGYNKAAVVEWLGQSQCHGQLMLNS